MHTVLSDHCLGTKWKAEQIILVLRIRPESVAAIYEANKSSFNISLPDTGVAFTATCVHFMKYEHCAIWIHSDAVLLQRIYFSLISLCISVFGKKHFITREFVFFKRKESKKPEYMRGVVVEIYLYVKIICTP